MKTLSLEQAVRKCKENGGRFRQEGSELWLIISNKPSQTIIFEKDGDSLDMSYQYFESKWIYEPPQSAFQRWNDSTVVKLLPNIERHHREKGRKEGWNAAIYKVIEVMLGYDVDKIKKLKEP